MRLDKIQYIPLSDIQLDPKNPRLPQSLHDATEEAIITWMLKDASLIDLIASIIENGFFAGEPIIVEDKKEGRDKYTVIEGNRRVAASKIISDPSLGTFYESTLAYLFSSERIEETKPEELPAFICNDRREVSEYLGFRHVTGVKPWSVLAKARFLYPMYIEMDRDEHETYRTLAKRIGSKASYVKRLMYGFEAFKEIEANDYYNIEHIEAKIKDDKFEISFLTDALYKPEIAKWLNFDKQLPNPIKGIDKERLMMLTFWLFENKSKKGPKGGARVKPNELQDLGVVLSNRTATVAFIEEEKELKEAVKLTNVNDKIISALILEARDRIHSAQTIAQDSKHPSIEDIELLDEIIKRARATKAILNEIIVDNHEF